jgi:hypothetical protein
MEYFKFNKGFAFFMAISGLTLSACNAGNGGGEANSTVGSKARVANVANTSYESTQIATSKSITHGTVTLKKNTNVGQYTSYYLNVLSNLNNATNTLWGDSVSIKIPDGAVNIRAKLQTASWGTGKNDVLNISIADDEKRNLCIYTAGFYMFSEGGC